MTYVPSTDLRKLSDDAIWDIIFDAGTDSEAYRRAVLMLQMRHAERQTAAAADMAASTRDLAQFTSGLRRASWALVFVGVATVLHALVQAFR